MAKRTKAKIVEVRPDELEAIKESIITGTLPQAYKETLLRIIDSYGSLLGIIEKKSMSLRRLQTMLFGGKTESRSNIERKRAIRQKCSTPTEKRGHGRRKTDEYIAAVTEVVAYQGLKKGDDCPACGEGKVYSFCPMVLIRFTADAPLSAARYSLEQLRCNVCQKVFTAELPQGVCTDKYDERTRAMVALLRYGSGFPFCRLASLQKSIGHPFPVSNQWEAVCRLVFFTVCVYDHLVTVAAQGKIIHNDDTVMQITSLVRPDKEKYKYFEGSRRTGIFTTGLVSVHDDFKVAIFNTGQKHAGENFKQLIMRRHPEAPPVIQMCDALSRNVSPGVHVLLAYCLCHARRNFAEIAHLYYDKCIEVINKFAIVYQNETKTMGKTAAERLAFHREKSLPVMMILKRWLQQQFDKKEVEPNSSLGEAIQYTLNHWDRLTLFLRVKGAPLDNNICERALKKAILHRKNSLFYKTETGAWVGDVMMSIIHTCNLNEVDPFKYLVEIQKKHDFVKIDPGKWMPWNYLENAQAQVVAA